MWDQQLSDNSTWPLVHTVNCGLQFQPTNGVVLSEPASPRFGAFSRRSGSVRAEAAMAAEPTPHIREVEDGGDGALLHDLRSLLSLKYESAPRAEYVVGWRIV